jgi:hypothetical protein
MLNNALLMSVLARLGANSSHSGIHPLSTFLTANEIVDHFKAVRPFSSEGKLAPGMSVQGGLRKVGFPTDT